MSPVNKELRHINCWEPEIKLMLGSITIVKRTISNPNVIIMHIQNVMPLQMSNFLF